MALEVSIWKDTAAIEAWLLDQTMREDAALDLCAMALALALHGRPEAKPATYAAHLDRLVEEAARSPGAASAHDPATQVAALNAVLFGGHAYRGDEETYDDLANADLTRVIDRKKGMPITLSIIYLHMARSLGWPAWGISFPGHFLVRIGRWSEGLIIDPFTRGAVAETPRLEELLRRVYGDEAKLGPEHLAEAENREILLRLQNNIKLRSAKQGDAATALAAVERMILIAPSHPTLWLEAAQFSAETGQLKKARHCLDAVARFDVKNDLKAQAGALRAQLKSRLN